MATDSVMGLFTDPQQYQQAQNQSALQRGIDLAQLDPFQRASAQLYQGGYMAGGAIGGALGGQDPQLQLATLRQSVLQGVDQTDAKSLRAASQKLADAKDLQGASALAQQSVAIQAKIDEKQAAREQALLISREKNQTTEQIAADRNALMVQIAQMNASLRNANSDVQRQLIEQRIADLKTKASEKQQTLESQAQGRVAAFDSALGTLDILDKHKGKKDVVGTLSGGVLSVIPGTDAAGFATQLETFKAQTFIPMVSALKGMGALSDAEGKKLTAAVGALDPKMKLSEFNAAVARIKADLEAARQRASTLPGMGDNAGGGGSSSAKVKKWGDL
jgi:hypothetical protein